MDELEYFESELEFLKNYGILDDDSASKIFTTICTYTNPEWKEIYSARVITEIEQSDKTTV